MGDPGWFQTHRERIVSLAQAGCMLFMGRERRAEARAAIRSRAFSRIAHEGRWGEKFSSGCGSSVDYTTNARAAIGRVIEQFDTSPWSTSPAETSDGCPWCWPRRRTDSATSGAT